VGRGKTLRQGRRRFKLIMTSDDRGEITPAPRHFHRARRFFDGTRDQTILKFKIITRGIEVQHLYVLSDKQRNGWGSDMVLALANAFPSQKIWVSGANSKSAALFAKLHSYRPGQICATPGDELR